GRRGGGGGQGPDLGAARALARYSGSADPHGGRAGAIDYGTPRQRILERVTASELRAHQRAGHFAKGSMGPKVEAALRHLAGGGRRAIIGHLDRAAAALAGSSGTHVVAD